MNDIWQMIRAINVPTGSAVIRFSFIRKQTQFILIFRHTIRIMVAADTYFKHIKKCNKSNNVIKKNINIVYDPGNATNMYMPTYSTLKNRG